MKKNRFHATRKACAATLAALTLFTCTSFASAAQATDDLDGGLSFGSPIASLSSTSATYQVVFPAEGDYYLVPEANPNFALDLTGGGTATYQPFQLWELNRTDAQVFHLERVDGDWYKLVHKASGKVVNVVNGDSRDDARLWLYPDDGTDACLFRFADHGNGSYLIQNKIDGRVLDLDNALCFNGSIVHLWSLHAGLSARWKLVPVSSSPVFTTTTMYVNTSSLNLNVRSAPSTSSSIIGKLGRGTQVTVLESSGDWKKVQSNSLTGWCSAAYLSSQAPSDDTLTVSEQQIYNRLQQMIGGTYASGTYQVNTTYRGPYYSEQCKGFAKSVFQTLFGYNIGSTRAKPNNYLLSINTSKTKLVGSLTSLSSQSDTALKNLLTQAHPGDFLQVRRSHGGSHSMIVLSTSSTGVTVYECNVDGANGIRTATYTWAFFRSTNAAVGLYTAIDYRLH